MEKTCGYCNYMNLNPLLGGVFATCRFTDKMVPSTMDTQTKKITFWRIPLSCPRTDVFKSEHQAPEKEWVTWNFAITKTGVHIHQEEVPRYNKQGRHLNEQDTLRVIVLAIKHMSQEHHDWPELMTYVDKFDASAPEAPYGHNR